VNPGASLSWVVSTLIVICIALSEEIVMRRQRIGAYERYASGAPFMLPLPGAVSRAISLPFRLVRGRERAETGWDLVWTFAIYLPVVCLLSLPFLILDWPGEGGWATWPF
jgi:hypothetical protein